MREPNSKLDCGNPRMRSGLHCSQCHNYGNGGRLLTRELIGYLSSLHVAPRLLIDDGELQPLCSNLCSPKLETPSIDGE